VAGMRGDSCLGSGGQQGTAGEPRAAGRRLTLSLTHMSLISLLIWLATFSTRRGCACAGGIGMRRSCQGQCPWAAEGRQWPGAKGAQQAGQGDACHASRAHHAGIATIQRPARRCGPGLRTMHTTAMPALRPGRARLAPASRWHIVLQLGALQGRSSCARPRPTAAAACSWPQGRCSLRRIWSAMLCWALGGATDTWVRRAIARAAAESR
jgi:hypothetical protein